MIKTGEIQATAIEVETPRVYLSGLVVVGKGDPLTARARVEQRHERWMCGNRNEAGTVGLYVAEPAQLPQCLLLAEPIDLDGFQIAGTARSPQRPV